MVQSDAKKLTARSSGSLDMFTLRCSATVGTKRSGLGSGFVHSVTSAVDSFYADVLQPLREWVPAAPHPADPDDTSVNEH